MVVFGLPLVLHILAGVALSTADRWTVSVHLGAHALGIYGAGAQLGMVMAILADAFVKAYGPWLYARLSSGRPVDKLCAMGAIYMSMPAFIAIASAVGVVLVLASEALLGPQYRAAASVLPWFMLGGAFSGVYLSTSVLFFFAGRTGLLATATSSAAVCGATATWFLVASFGVDGAAMGYALTQAILALLTSLTAFRAFELPWREPVKALTAWSHQALGIAPHQPA